MTATRESRADRQLASVETRLQQTSDRLKAEQASLDRAVAHEQHMNARRQRYRSQGNERAWSEAWAVRERLDNELRALSAEHTRLGRQLDALRSRP